MPREPPSAACSQVAARRIARLGARRDHRASGAGGSPHYARTESSEADLEELLRRQRPAAAARRRAGRHLPVRRARLESDHGVGTGRDRGRAAHLLGRLPRSAATTSGPTRRRSPARSGPGTTSSRSGATEIAGCLPGGRPARRDAADPDRAGAAVPARSGGSRERDHRDRDRRGCRRAVLGLRPVQGGGAARAQRRRPRAAPRSSSTGSTPTSGRRCRASRAGLARASSSRRAPTTSCSARISPGSRPPAGVKAPIPADVAEPIGPEQPRSTGCAPGCRRRSASWSKLERAAWLEVTTLLEPYLLAAQGDRVAMAHGVEGRYPFLDIGSSRTLPSSAGRPSSEACTTRSPCASWPRGCCRRRSPQRGKQPYRAPEVDPFFAPGAPDMGRRDRSRRRRLPRQRNLGPAAGRGLLRRCRAGRATGVREGMALVGVLSTQLWHRAVHRRRVRRLPCRDRRASGENRPDSARRQPSSQETS